ncbi:MAG: PucR family transcriptional regulator [Tissierellia bacterium]|nr:PucR family transcriptional regulator [Tissierellia bacterium]
MLKQSRPSKREKIKAYSSESELMQGLLELVSMPLSFGELIQKMSELLGNPLVVIDSVYRVIAHSKITAITDHMWKKNIQRGSCSMDFIEVVQEFPEIQKAKYHQKAYDVHCEWSPTPKRVCSIAVESKHIGDVLLIGCQRDLQELDNYGLEQVARIIGHRWSQLKEEGFTGDNTQQTLLQELLAGEFSSTSEAERRLAYFNIELSDNMILFGIDIPKSANKKKKEAMILFDKTLSATPSVYYQNLLIYFVTPKYLAENMSTICEVIKSYGLNAGISLPFNELVQTNLAFQEVKNSILWGTEIMPESCIYDYKILQIYSLFDGKDDVDKIMRLIPRELHYLQSYDMENSSNLVETLEWWLFYEGSIRLTADELFVHRNTITYRLGKIQELGGWDLEDFATRKQLALGLQALKWIDIIKK